MVTAKTDKRIRPEATSAPCIILQCGWLPHTYFVRCTRDKRIRSRLQITGSLLFRVNKCLVKFHLFGWRRRWKTLTRSKTDKRISPKPPPPFGGGQLVHHLCTQVKCEPPPDHGIMTYILQRGHAVVSIAPPAAAAGAETFTSSPSSVISRTPSCGGAQSGCVQCCVYGRACRATDMASLWLPPCGGAQRGRVNRPVCRGTSHCTDLSCSETPPFLADLSTNTAALPALKHHLSYS